MISGWAGVLPGFERDGHPSDLGDDFLQQLHLFTDNVRVETVSHPVALPTRVRGSPRARQATRSDPLSGPRKPVPEGRRGPCYPVPAPQEGSSLCGVSPGIPAPVDPLGAAVVVRIEGRSSMKGP